MAHELKRRGLKAWCSCGQFCVYLPAKETVAIRKAGLEEAFRDHRETSGE